MLSLLRRHASLFKQHLYEEVMWWHENLLWYLQTGHENQKAGSLALQEFYKEIANVSKDKIGADHKEIVCVSICRLNYGLIVSYGCLACFY